MAKAQSYVVILAGGGGTRLWPKSRNKSPKQFLELINDKTLFQETFERVKKAFSIKNIFVVASEEFVDEIKREVPEILEENILIEPSPKNTTAAAGLAAAYISKRDPQAIISTLASDHFIKEKGKFLDLLSVSQKAAKKGNYLVTIGIRPTQAHTGFGYIHVDGEAFKIGKTQVFKVSSFKEKPDATIAQAYFSSGEFFWNSNINSYKAAILLEAIKKYLPGLYKVLEKINSGAEYKIVSDLWQGLSSEPIDTAILEKAKNVLMVPGNIFWFDIGDWSSLYSVISTKNDQNVTVGKKTEHLHIDTQGCLIHSDDRLVATIGLKNITIIDTRDVLLVCPREESQKVKKFVEKLGKKKKNKYL